MTKKMLKWMRCICFLGMIGTSHSVVAKEDYLDSVDKLLRGVNAKQMLLYAPRKDQQNPLLIPELAHTIGFILYSIEQDNHAKEYAAKRISTWKELILEESTKREETAPNGIRFITFEMVERSPLVEHLFEAINYDKPVEGLFAQTIAKWIITLDRDEVIDYMSVDALRVSEEDLVDSNQVEENSDEDDSIEWDIKDCKTMLPILHVLMFHQMSDPFNAALSQYKCACDSLLGSVDGTDDPSIKELKEFVKCFDRAMLDFVLPYDSRHPFFTAYQEVSLRARGHDDGGTVRQ